MKSIKHADVVHYQPPRYFGVLVLGSDRKVLMQEVFMLRSGIRLSTYLNHIHVPDEILCNTKECHVVELAL